MAKPEPHENLLRPVRHRRGSPTTRLTIACVSLVVILLIIAAIIMTR